MAYPDNSEVLLVDPDEVAVRRVPAATAAIDEYDRFVVTWEKNGDEFAVALTPSELGSFVTATLSALGFPEGDTTYVAERIIRS